MYRGEGGCFPEGWKGQRGFLISKIACPGQGNGARCCLLPAPPLCLPGGVHSSKVGREAAAAGGGGSRIWTENEGEAEVSPPKAGGRPQSV